MENLIIYSISDDIKRELGYIIREMRLLKYQEVKEDYIIEMNPYTKENFCENNHICHYHTLTKLENDLVVEDELYHVFLNKLGLSFQIESDEHEKNMEVLFSLKNDVLSALEFLNDDRIKLIKTKMCELNFKMDCIANFYLNLLKFMYEIMFEHKHNVSPLEIEHIIDLYKGVYQAMAYHALGFFYLNSNDQDKAIHYSKQAMHLYKKERVSPGLSKYPLLEAYIQQGDRIKSFHLAIELEKYYLSTNNTNRLMSVYNYLSYYYLIINSVDLANAYYEKSEDLKSQDPTLDNYILHFNWGHRTMLKYKYEEALQHILKAYESCKNPSKRLMIINRLIILNKILKTEVDLSTLIEEGKDYMNEAPNLEQYMLRYFIYQNENSRYMRTFALEKIIPMLKGHIETKIILLFFYSDLYD